MVRLNGPDLLDLADAAGLLVWRDGTTLKVRGPRSAAAVAKRLTANKPAVLAALDERDRDRRPVERTRWGGREPTAWCPGHGHPAGWSHVASPAHAVCTTCHPPPCERLVARRFGADRTG